MTLKNRQRKEALFLLIGTELPKPKSALRKKQKQRFVVFLSMPTKKALLRVWIWLQVNLLRAVCYLLVHINNKQAKSYFPIFRHRYVFCLLSVIGVQNIYLCFFLYPDVPENATVSAGHFYGQNCPVLPVRRIGSTGSVFHPF